MQRIFKILSILYFLLFIASSLVFWARGDSYVRPELYFVLLALISTIVFAQIMIVNKNYAQKILIFFQIFIIALSFTFTQQALYETVLGRDPWAHWTLVEIIARTGQIPNFQDILNPYVTMPNFHILTATSMIVCEFSYKWAQYFTIAIPTLIILMLTALLLANKVFENQKIGYLACLFVAISCNVLDMVGKSIIPNSLGVAIAFLMLYLFMKDQFTRDSRWQILVIVMALGLVFLHTIAYTFLLLQSVILLFAFIFHDRKHFGKVGMWVITLLALAILQWAYISIFYFEHVIRIIAAMFLYGFYIEGYKAALAVPFEYVLLARLGMVIFFGLAGIGILLTFSEHHRDKYKLALVLIAGAMIGGSISFLMPALAAISHRFWFYGQVLGGFFVSFLMVKLWVSTKSPMLKNVFTLALVFFLSWLMFVASVANNDNPLVSEYTIRTGWFDSEIASAKFILLNSNNIPIASDFDFAFYLRYFKTNMIESNRLLHIPLSTPRTFKEVFQESEGLFILRSKLIEDRQFILGGPWDQNPHVPLGRKINNLIKDFSTFRNLVYNNQNIHIFMAR